ncbi:CHAT domain-containing protein [Nodosilinea sp. P-1105]|uniref:CHAT domain-containing protein n=1 Tax=Nodosilinea sp. P-1105 TaxID=2546229 RepID=UPI00146F7F53|nr:CHAT domain-containing protein [Nodosilinea sp. P-1105]NMF82696.1 tetratricopeptide repeat protein [Nodosilinea sp. P-1105]
MLNPFKRWRKPQPPPTESLSQAEYESLVKDLATQASQGASWPKLLATLQNQGLTPEQVAQWMTQYGGQWVQQPETEFGQGLLRLSEVAEGSLAEIAKTLGQAIIQGPEPPPAVEFSATSESAENAANLQNPKQASVLEPDLTVDQSESVDLSLTPQPKSLIASDWLDQGDKLFNLGRYEEALASYDQVISLQPDIATCWSIRGLTLYRLGRYEKALASCNQAISLQPDLAMAWGNRGLTLKYLGRYEEALASIDQVISLQPDEAQAWNIRGDTLYNLERYEEALASFDQVIVLRPDDAMAWYNRGVVLSHNPGRYEEALASFEEAISLQPDLAMAWGNRGIILSHNLGRYEKALASFEQAISLQPENFTAWGNRGLTLDNLERYEEALASFEQAISLQPENFTAWGMRGSTLKNLERYEEALASYEQAISLQPNDVASWGNRGITLKDLGRYEAALASFDKVISLQPDDVKAWGNRGSTLDDLGRYEEALASYDQAVSLQPDYVAAWVNRGITLDKLGRHEAALVSYDQVIPLQPDDAIGWFNRGNTLADLGRYEEALASYDQAISLQPDLIRVWVNRGNTLKNLGRYEEALASYDQAISLQPDLVEVWVNRGVTVAWLAGYRPDNESLFRLKIQQELDSRSRLTLISFFNRDVDAIRAHVLKSLEQSKTQLSQTFVDADNPQLLALIQQPPSPELEVIIAAPTSAELQFLVNQPVLPDVLQKITDDAARHPSRSRPELRVGGYQGQLNSYQAELGENSQDEPKKAICKDTHPEGWGTLHRAIGRAHYFEGRKQVSPRPYWRKAANSFRRALETLQPPQFETLYFETLQDLIRALLGIGETQEAETLQQEATAYIQRVLAEAGHNHERQHQLGLWLAKFEQLTVDAAIQAGDFRKALSTAETAKNVCLRWLLDLDEVPDITCEQMQALVDEHTAMVYWHLSPAALTTFLLLPGATEPVVIPPPDLAVDPTQVLANDERPPGLKQLLGWEDWLSQWNQDYDNYSSAQNKTDKQPAGFDFAQPAGALSEVEGHNLGEANYFEQPPKTVDLTAWRRGHPWRTQMDSRLEFLGQLLNVEAIHAALQDYPIQRLRLIPHRDLHRFPLHIFFDRYDCTYLPSAKVGLDRLSQTEPPVYKNLLIAENPKSTATVKTLTQKLDELPFAEVEAELIRQQFRESGGDQPGRITTLENQQVPYDRLLGALGQTHDVFHFTGHGLYNSRNPAQSCLFLTGGDRLTLADIVHPAPDLGYHDLSPYQLVFLAACETGVAGNQTITDDYVGLVSAFLKANAGCVVSTLWRIESGSSLIFVSQFYQALLTGDPPAQALRAAQAFLKTATYDQIATTLQGYIELIDRSGLDKGSLRLTLQDELRRIGSNSQSASTIESHRSPDRPYRHPYYWAAYTISGL